MNAVRLARIIITTAHPYAHGELELRPEVQPTAVNAMTICRFTGFFFFHIFLCLRYYTISDRSRQQPAAAAY